MSQSVHKGRFTTICVAMFSFLLPVLGLQIKDELSLEDKQKRFESNTNMASRLDSAMYSVYCVPDQITRRREVRLPLLFPWSEPFFWRTNYQNDSVRLFQVASRQQAQIAIDDYRNSYQELLKSQGLDDALGAYVRLVTKGDESYYHIETPGKTVRIESIKIDGWDRLPNVGVWKAVAPCGKEWSGELSDPKRYGSNILSAIRSRVQALEGVFCHSFDTYTINVISNICSLAVHERILGVRMQLDGSTQDETKCGFFMAGYLVEGRRSGLWVTSLSTGYLVVENYINGEPCGFLLRKPYCYDATYGLEVSDGEGYSCVLRRQSQTNQGWGLFVYSKDNEHPTIQVEWDKRGVPSASVTETERADRFRVLNSESSPRVRLFECWKLVERMLNAQ